MITGSYMGFVVETVRRMGFAAVAETETAGISSRKVAGFARR